MVQKCSTTLSPAVGTVFAHHPVTSLLMLRPPSERACDTCTHCSVSERSHALVNLVKAVLLDILQNRLARDKLVVK